MAVVLTGNSLVLADVVRVARGREHVELHADVPALVQAGRAVVERALEGDAPVYGLTTGVGVRKRTRVGAAELAEFNRRLIHEHLVGQGDPAPDDVVRAQLLLLANAFARGTAGVRIELVEHIVATLNGDTLPTVRSLGSIGMADLPANAAEFVQSLVAVTFGSVLGFLPEVAVKIGAAGLFFVFAISLWLRKELAEQEAHMAQATRAAFSKTVLW